MDIAHTKSKKLLGHTKLWVPVRAYGVSSSYTKYCIPPQQHRTPAECSCCEWSEKIACSYIIAPCAHNVSKRTRLASYIFQRYTCESCPDPLFNSRVLDELAEAQAYVIFSTGLFKYKLIIPTYKHARRISRVKHYMDNQKMNRCSQTIINPIGSKYWMTSIVWDIHLQARLWNYTHSLYNNYTIKGVPFCHHWSLSVQLHPLARWNPP